MSMSTVYGALRESGIPFAHLAFPDGEAPPLPWGVYYRLGDNTSYADNRRHVESTKWCVELYQRSYSKEVVEAVENAISSIAPFERGADEWDEQEGCGMTPYYFIETERN